jgi:transcriptional regulator with XRE-family HTH domain
MTVATCACRGHMAQPGTEHTPQGCSVIPFAVLTAITDAMAADLGLAPATLISLEAGTINPTLARVEQMAAAYGIELELKAKRIRTPAPAGTGDLLTADVDERATRPPAVTP